MPITIKSEREIELMTEAGRILGIVHKELEKALKPGMSTLDIDALGEEVIRSYGCEPSFLNYNGYPAYLISTQIMFVCNRRTYPCRSSLQIFSCPFDPSGKFLELFRIFSDNVCHTLYFLFLISPSSRICWMSTSL